MRALTLVIAGNRGAAGLLSALGLSVMVGCVAPPPTQPPTNRPTSPVPSVAPSEEPTIVFVKHNVGPGTPAWLGLVPGSLEQVANCLYIVSDLGEKWLALWPPNYNLVQAYPAVVAPIGGAPLRVGQHAEFFGGAVDAAVKEQADILDDLLDGEPPPDECGTSHYWVVTGHRPT